MAGLVVIDFIDMEKFANRRSIEKKLKDSLKSDRSKIQVGKISSFGLLEMSRQRIRSSIKEGVYSPCSNCDGTGLIRSIDSRSLELLRTISEISIRENIKKIDAELSELKRCKSKALCCGAGGAQMFKESEKGEKEINIERAEEIKDNSAKIVATGCPFCNTMLTDGTKSFENEDKVEVLDIAELIVKAKDL